MSIPNTTPTPNELFNGEMRKMRDAELRVVMIVTRATFGWVMDENTGMRKQEDWITHSQMVEKSGKSARAINYAIQACIDNGWIEARDKEGKTLETSEKRSRHGRKIFYRLGHVFLTKNRTDANNAGVQPPQNVRTTPAKKDTKPPQNVRTTKATIQKQLLQKERTETPGEIATDFFRKEGEETRRKILDEVQNTGYAKIGDQILTRELGKFILYWTEPNKSGTKRRWQLQPTFDVKRRFYTWLSRVRPNEQPKLITI